MTEINIPVLVLDDECRTCEEIVIVTDGNRLYAGGECVSYEMRARCGNVYRCALIQKRIREREEAKEGET